MDCYAYVNEYKLSISVLAGGSRITEPELALVGKHTVN